MEDMRNISNDTTGNAGNAGGTAGATGGAGVNGTVGRPQATTGARPARPSQPSFSLNDLANSEFSKTMNGKRETPAQTTQSAQNVTQARPSQGVTPARPSQTTQNVTRPSQPAQTVQQSQSGQTGVQRSAVRPSVQQGQSVSRPTVQTAKPAQTSQGTVRASQRPTVNAASTSSTAGTASAASAGTTPSKANVLAKNTKKDVEVRVIEPLPVPDKIDNKVEGKQNFVLYVLIDKQIDGMLDYFRYYGLKASRIFTDVGDVRDMALMQVDPCLMLVIDTGSGKFVNMSVRKDLIDMLGMMDEDNKAIIFYSDSNLEYDIKYAPSINGKDIKWFKYKSTAGVLADMIQELKIKNLNFLQDSDYGKTTAITEDLCFKGIADPEYVKQPRGAVQINTRDIVARQQQITADHPSLDKFKLIIK